VCVEGPTSRQEKSKRGTVSETIACIEELQARVKPKIAGAFKYHSKAKNEHGKEVAMEINKDDLSHAENLLLKA
jgi:hypothetical protein